MASTGVIYPLIFTDKIFPVHQFPTATEESLSSKLNNIIYAPLYSSKKLLSVVIWCDSVAICNVGEKHVLNA